ncbi:DinB family protein [Algoriphagus sp.]|uniref:DinB family protein n=1 Tax=Algoriphagus sp. TaxID=1872435 RepID=UPI0025E6242A|nr:DinB family protein [Algoriphagus sp.]
MKFRTLIAALLFGVFFISNSVFSQDMNSFLVKQLEYAHSNENWFAPVNVATEGLNAEQANWHDGSENHSVAQLVSHLVFWNDRLLKAIQGKTVPNFNEDNKVTFSEISEEEWSDMVKKLDQILTEIETETKKLEGESLVGWSETLVNIAAHNAYHTGQIVYLRKQKGWWR